jgi:hypothetical protein
MPLDELCKVAVEPLLTHTVVKSELKACRHSIEQVARVRRRNDGHDETCGCSFTARCIEHVSIKTMTRRRRQVNRQGSVGSQRRQASADADLVGGRRPRSSPHSGQQFAPSSACGLVDSASGQMCFYVVFTTCGLNYPSTSQVLHWPAVCNFKLFRLFLILNYFMILEK